MNAQTIAVIQIVVSIILTVLIVLQAKGTGIGSTFGGDGGFYRTKRGAERLMFILTIIFSALFVGATVLGLIL